MSRYGQYPNSNSNHYDDPVGSSQPQPSGYTYQTSNPPASSYSSAAAAPSGYAPPSYGSSSSSSYGAQAFGSNAQGSNNNPTNHAAAALSRLGGQDYHQSGRVSSGQYATGQCYGSNGETNYGAGNPQPPNCSQVNNSPLYNTTTQASTFGRLGVPDQRQNSNTYASPSSTHRNAPSNTGTNSRSQSAQNPPQRYNSPLHAVQPQQHSHQKQSSRGSNAQRSPHTANAVRHAQQPRQPSASVEPSPTTVDPSQVYDNRAELVRIRRSDAERRKKLEAEQAAKKAEEDRVEEEKAKAEEARKKAAENVESAKMKDQQDRKNEARRKAREEKRQSKSAATTLQRMALMGAEGSGAGDDEEAEMRAMFKKMREFNSKNPAMLAKLWEEERKQHADSQSPPAEKPLPTPAGQTTYSKQSAARSQPGSAPQPNKVPPTQPPAAHSSKPAAQASPQATASRPAAASSSASLWPPHKKGALADATSKWLTGLPENAGKNVSQQAVLNILNSNPSYVKLCESLEGLGMKFGRSMLARALLKAVPDGLRSQPKPSTPVTGTSGATAPGSAATRDPTLTGRPTSQAANASQAKATNQPNTVSYTTPLSLSDAAREVNQMHKTASQYGGPVQSSQHSPYPNQSQTNGSRPQSQARQASQSVPPEVKPEIQAEEPPRAPADKEEAARKRTFGDLVDLTKDDESEDDGPPPKKMFQMPASGPAPSNASHSQTRDPLAYLQGDPQPSFQQPYKPSNYQCDPSAYITDPAVMAPTQRQTTVLPNNDRSTQPAQRPPKPKGPSAESLQQARMRGRMLVEPIMRDRVARKSRYDSSTIARDVLLATGRHPDMRGLNQHLSNMQRLLGQHGGETDTAGTRCDLSTIRWEIIDPEPPLKRDKPATTATTAAEGSARPESLAVPLASAPSTVRYEAPFTAQAQQQQQPPKTKARRGRPRLADSAPHHLLGKKRASTPNAITSTPASPKNNTPRSPADPALLAHANKMAATGTPVGYSAFRQIGPDGQVIKKKGRPVGWRKNVHSREAQGLPPHYPKKAGYSASQNRPAKEHSLVEPQWQSFRCEWKGCKAELQNLDTLKKHMLKVHGREMEGGRGYECAWKGCDRQPGEGGGFNELEEWLGHVDKEHLQPIGWKQGDGPTGGSLGESPFHRASNSSPPYLNDGYGRSVTPIIDPTPTLDANAITQLSIHTAATTRLERDTAAELKKLEVHKGIVGPTIDRQGCILANDERRATFLGDEDFEDVVEAEKDEGLGAWE